MPMDIRDFFAKKGAPATKGAASKSKAKKKSGSTSAKSAGAGSSSSSKSKTKISAVSKRKAALSPIDEEKGRISRKKASLKKKQINFDDDDDTDATMEPVDIKDSDDETTEVEEELNKKSPAATISRLKKKVEATTKNLKEVSTSDFFGASSSKKRSSPRESKPRNSYALEDNTDDDFEIDPAPASRNAVTRKSTFFGNDNEDDDGYASFDDSEDDKPISKKRPSPQVSKNTSPKPEGKVSPFKKQKLLESDADDEGFEIEATPSTSRKKRGASTSSDNKKSSPISSAIKEEASPPSSKKRKTTPGRSSKKKPPVKKEEPLEPTLELDSFDTDKAVPECMVGNTFVFTGQLENFTRDDATELVKIMGGRVTTSISSKTTYLVVGEVLEDGRPYDQGRKYQKAVELGTVKIVKGVKRLFGLAKLYSEKAKAGMENHPNVDPSAVTSIPLPKVNDATNSAANPYAKKQVTNPYTKKSVANPYAKAANPYSKSSQKVAGSLKNHDDINYNPVVNTAPNALWVDKYAPANTRTVLGNKEQVSKLSIWLAKWESRFNTEQAIGKTFANGPWKAALLSGPPGIGKTTSATLVAMEAGRDLVEFNASDVRSKKFMHENLGDITGSKSLQAYFQKDSSCKGGKTELGNHQKRCIIMDEVDGMGGGDRGGIAELIQMIKNSRVPIICICNDRQSQKLKSLLPYCLDLRFRRPMKAQIARAAIAIAEKEGLQVEQNAAESIAESCGNDIRQVVNCLQMWASDNRISNLTYKGLKERERTINKDSILRVSLFDAAKMILEGRRGLSGASPAAELDSFMKRTDAFFVDYSFTGLLVQQNYPKVMGPQYLETKRKNDDQKLLEFLERMHLASESMSDYAMVENQIRGGGSNMNWQLLPFSGTLAVKAGFHAGGQIGCAFPGFPEFTTWLGRNSSKGKKERLLQELNHHMNYKISGGTQEVRQSYLPFLRQRFLEQLKNSTHDDRNTVAISLMDSYGLDREDVLENLDEFGMDPKGQKIGDIDSKSKAAFTREYNRIAHKSQALVDEQGAPSKKKKGGGSLTDLEDPDAINDDAPAGDYDSDEEEDLEKIKAAFKKKGRKMPAKKESKGKVKGGKGKKK